jgi:hypothetical protein
MWQRGSRSVSSGDDVGHSFEPGRFAVRDMRHLGVRQGERSDESLLNAEIESMA